MLLDAHHHFWKYTDADFGWISDDMARIRRDFLPADLEATLRESGVDGAISVQARQSLEETEWLLSLSAGTPFIKGVVGWVPLTDTYLPQHLDRLCTQPKLRGVRHVCQAEPDGFLLREDFNVGISQLRNYGLAYDLLIVERQLPEALAFVDRHPAQTIILDHVAKPRIAAGELEPWAANLRELARRPHVFCKISGMVTEADFLHWTADQLRPYFDVALEAFGANRLLFGSDWPVCLVAGSYARWLETVRAWIAPLSADERTAIFAGNTLRAYGLTHSLP